MTERKRKFWKRLLLEHLERAGGKMTVKKADDLVKGLPDQDRHEFGRVAKRCVAHDYIGIQGVLESVNDWLNRLGPDYDGLQMARIRSGRVEFQRGHVGYLVLRPAGKDWLDEIRQQEREAEHKKIEAKSEQPMPANGAKVKRENVPAQLRELGQPNGRVLDAPYLAGTIGWDISSKELNQAFHKTRELTYRLKVGHAWAYLYTELDRLRKKWKSSP